jgi:hypothetical protein
MLKIIPLFTLFLGLSLLSSCELDGSPTCSLSINVKGSLSNKPRNNLRVSLYHNLEDARDGKNDIDCDHTDSNGDVIFKQLNSNKIYYIRVQALLNNSIFKCDDLGAGRNQLNLSIL